MIVEKLVLTDTNDVNCYLIGDERDQVAMIIDPGRFDNKQVSWPADHGLTVALIFLTHGHHDHTGGVGRLREYFPTAEVACSAADATLSGVKPNRLLADGEELLLGSLRGRLVALPGHTPGGLGLIFDGYAFTGDALFSGSVGGTRDHAAFVQQRDAVANAILTLPDHTIVCPGHGPSSTVGVERRFNSFFFA